MEKVIMIAFVGVIFIVLLKEHKASLAFLLTITVCMLIVFQIVEYAGILLEGMEVFEAYIDASGYYIKLILKMVGITYLCEFGTNICKDAGQGAIASQVEVFGKIIVFVTGLPILIAIVEQMITFEG